MIKEVDAPALAHQASKLPGWSVAPELADALRSVDHAVRLSWVEAHEVVNTYTARLHRWEDGHGPETVDLEAFVEALKEHRKVGLFSLRIRPAFSNGLRVQDWLAGQPFGVQHEFGVDVMTQIHAGTIK